MCNNIPCGFLLPCPKIMNKKFFKLAIKYGTVQVCINLIVVFIASAISYGCCKFLTHGANIDLSRLLLLHESIFIFFYMALITIHHVNEYTKEKDHYEDQKIIIWSWCVHAGVSALILIATILYSHYY